MKSVLTKLAGLAGIIAILALTGCSEGVGLGESVDTESPTLSITYPPLGSAIMENFVVAGTCGDDKAVTKVEVTLKRIDKETKIVETRDAEIASDQKSWQIEFNPNLGDEELGYNGWTLADGNYAVDVIAYDNAGHKSGLASTSFEIDNTAPFFVLSSPAVVYGSSNFTELGSVFAVEGTIVDDHSIDEMEVNIFDSTGTQLNSTPYIENDIATAGGTSVQIARYIENGTTTVNQRYEEIYDVSSTHYGTTEQYYCSIKLTDNAKLYQNPADSGVSMGNTTSTVYLYDDVYQSLVSDKAGKGLSYAVLKTIINKTAAETVTGTNGTTSTSSEILSALTSAAKNTGLQDEAPSFSLNPAANPTYAVSGFQYDFTDGFIPQDGSAGGTITVTASMGLDEVKLLPQTMKVWIIDSGTTALTETALDEKIQKLTALTKAAMYQDAENPTKATLEFDEETLTNIKNETGFVLLYDYKDYSKGSVSSVTIPVVLDKDIISIVQDKYYFVAVTGNDADLVEFSQKNYYGFHGQAAGTPPTIAISTPKNNSYQATSEFSYTGKITTKETPFKSLEFKLTVEDESTGTTLDDYIYVKSTYNSNTKTWTDEAGLTIAADGTWTFTPSQADGYAKIAVGEGTAYLYSLYALVTSASGQSQKIEEYSVRIDRITPVVEFTAVTPVIEGNNFYEGAQDKNHTYVNGTIEFKGSIAENYSLKSVYYKIFVDGIEKYSSLDPNKLVTKTSFNNSIDTPDYEDGKEIEVIVYAEDVVGHVGFASTKAYNKEIYGLEENIVINQDTDKPQIKFSNADSTVTDVSGIDSTTNFFSSTNKNLLANLSDDDAIDGATVTFYKADGTTVVGDPVTKTGKISQLSVAVPSEEGTYFAQVSAKDSNGKVATSEKFCFVVDNNAPEITYKDTGLKGYYGTGDSAIEFTVTASDQLLDSLEVGVKHDDDTLKPEDFAANYVTVTPLTDTTTQKSYKVRVSLKDGSGNWINNGSWLFTLNADDKVGRSTAVNTITQIVDTNPPTLEISQEPSNLFLDKDSSQIYKGTYVESESGIAGVYYTTVAKGVAAPAYPAEGLVWKDVSFNTGTWIAYADFAELTDNNSYDVYFAAVDNSGNFGYAKGTSITLDASSPVVTVTAPTAVTSSASPEGVLISGTVSDYHMASSMSLSITDAAGTETTQTITFTSDEMDTLNAGNPVDWSYTLNMEGVFTIKANAKDLGNRQTTVNVPTITIDRTGPAVTPTQAPEAVILNTSTGFESDASLNNYFVVKGGWSDAISDSVTVAWSTDGLTYSTTDTTQTSSTWTAKVPLTEGRSNRNIYVKLTDNLGNETVKSYTELTVDFGTPVVVMTCGTQNVTTNSTFPASGFIAKDAVSTISGTAADGNGIQSIAVTATDPSGNKVTSENSGYVLNSNASAGTFSIALTGTVNGTWNFDVVVKDNLERTTTISGINTVVDTVAPVITAVQNSNKEYIDISSSNKYNGSITESGSGIEKVYFYPKLSAETLPAYPTLESAGSWEECSIAGNNASWTLSADLEGLANNSTYTFYFVALDAAGNRSSDVTLTQITDNTAPVVTANAAVGWNAARTKATASGTVTEVNLERITVSVTATGTNDSNPPTFYLGDAATGTPLTKGEDKYSGTFEYNSTDDSAYISSLSTGSAAGYSYSFTGDGSYIVTVSAKDKAGKSDEASKKQFTFDMDNTAPTITVNNTLASTGAEIFDQETYTFTGTWSDNLAGTKELHYTVNGTEQAAITSFAGQTNWRIEDIPLTEGSGKSFTFWATDQNGNTSDVTSFTGITVDFAKPVIATTFALNSAPRDSIPTYIADGATLVISGAITESSGLSSIDVVAKKSGTAVASGNSGYTLAADKDAKTFTITLVGGSSSNGSWTFDITTTDVAGRVSKTTSLATEVDMTPPVWKNSWTENAVDKYFQVSGKNHVLASGHNWYNGASLKFDGCFEETGSGVNQIYAWVAAPGAAAPATADTSTATSSFVGTTSNGYHTWSSNIGEFIASSTPNSVYFVAVDNAGNTSAVHQVEIYRDELAPVIDTDAGTVLTNGALDIALNGTVTDDASGVASVALNFTYGASSTWEGNATLDTSVTPATWTATIPASVLANLTSGTVYQVKAVALDNAGNKYNGNAIKIDVDTTAPVATISAALSRTTGLNGTNTLSGTVTDGHKPVSFKLFYTLTDPSSATTPADNSGKPAGWTQIGEEITTEQDIYNWSGFDFDFTAKSAAANAADGRDTVYILPVAVDEAGNCNAYTKANNGTIAWNLSPQATGAQWEEFAVDLSKDRPTVKFSDLTDLSASGDASKLIIKNSTGGKITGLVTDDDSTTEKVVETFIISSSVITSADGFTLTTSGDVVTATADGKGTTTYNKTSGDWTYTPPSEDDGNKTVYIYIKDNNGHVFYSTATAAGYTVYNNPRFQVKTGTVMDNKAVLTYKSDNNSPSVESIQVAYSDSSSIADNAAFADFAATTKLGGKVRRYARFKVTAKDSNGIDDIDLELTGTLANGGAVPAVTMTGTTTTDNSATSWLSSVVDLDSFASGYVSVKATATDTSSMTGNGNNSFYCDQDVETENFMVNNPAATSNGTNEVSDDILTSKISMAGSATESLGAGIAKVSWLVPPCDENGNEVTYETIIADPDSYSWSSNKSSDTYTQWKFAFDGGTNTEDDKTHNDTFETMCNSANIAKGYYMTVSSGIYTIPVYFMIEDELGNVGFVGNYRLRYNPDADRPSSSILDPQTGATVGDRIRITGSAEDDVSVSAVYLQISSVKNSTTGEITWSSDDEVLAAAQTAGDSNSDSTYLDVTTLANSGITNVYDADNCPTGVEDTWWGIKAENTISWALVINKYGEFELENKKRTIYVRVCAVDNQGNNKGKAGIWSDPVEINIVQGAPKISFVETAQFTNNTIASGESSKYTSYDAGSYLTNQNGQWYIVANAYHASTISSIEVKSSVTGRNLTATASVDDIEADDDTQFGYFYKTTSDENVNVKIYIPVDTRFEGDITYTITAKEAGNNKTNSQGFTYKIDNVAPTIGELTSGNTRNTSLATVAGNKLVNSNGGLTSISTILNEEYSGFTMMAYYFLKDGKVYNPIPGGSSEGFTNQTATGYETTSLKEKKVTDDHNLYGVIIDLKKTIINDETGDYVTASNDEENGVYVTASALSDSNVRAGGLIQIDGIYYQIKNVDGTKIYVTGLSTTCTAETAFCPYALVIQYVSTTGDTKESIASGKPSEGYTMTENDGDGIIETVNKAGSKYTLETSIMSDELPDGETDIICVAFDKAGNISSTETKTMISNNLPRLSKVFLATDLNGDGKFAPFEFEYKQSINDVDTSAYAYSCLTATGQGQEGVTLTTTDSAGTKFAVRDKLAVTMELLSGADTSGSYAGIKYIAKLSDSDADGRPATDALATGVPVTGSLSDTVTGVDTTTSITDPVFGSLKAISGKGILFTNEKFTSGDAGALSGMTSAMENETSLATLTYLQISLWDAVNITADDEENDTYIATLDTSTDGVVSKYGNQYTYINIPVYIDVIDGIDPVPAIEDPTAHSDGGHVELSATLPSVFTAGNAKKYLDRDTKISGKVVFSGTVQDEKIIKSIKLKSGKAINSTLTDYVEVAKYNAGVLELQSAANATEGWSFDITETTAETQFSAAGGHKVNWTLTVDSRYVAGIAASDVLFTLYVSDGTNNDTDTYQVDIVPYITGIWRSASTKSVDSKTYRSTYGEYPVAIGDTLTVTGYNLPGANVDANAEDTYVHVGSTGVASTNVTATKQFTIGVPENSGELTVSVSGITSLNDKNNNANENNQEKAENTTKNDNSTSLGVLYDNRYLRVWDVGHYFKYSTDGNKPTFAMDKSGNLFTSWTLMGTASVQMQRGLNTTNKAVYYCYDQPDQETWLSIDKSKDTGDANVLVFPANVGSGGTPSSNGYGDARNIGGAWGIAVPNDLTADYTLYNKLGTTKNEKISKLSVRINGNPYTDTDGNMATAGYPLASYAMRREISQFQNARTARYGDSLHYVYYDKKNKALRYTNQSVVTGAEGTVKDNVVSTINDYQYKISGWNLIDGSTDGQDRVHAGPSDTWVTGKSDLVYNQTKNGNTTFKPETITATSVTYNTFDPNVGETIGISSTLNGVFKFELHTVSSVDGKKATWSDGNYDTTGTLTGVTVYRGDSNVVSKGAERVSAAGSHLSLDVTKTGKPVIVYFDAINETLRVAYTNSASPSMASKEDGADTWTRQSLDGIVSGGTYVQAKIDANNYLHILYRDSEGQMCYLKSSNAPDGAAYTFSKNDVMVVDTAGTYGTLSLIRTATYNSETETYTYTYTPCVSFLNSEGTANGVKYAILRTVDQGNSTTASLWDTMIVPAVKGNFVTGGEYIYTEGNSGSWNTTDEVATADCDAIIGYNTGRMDVLFLKSE